MKYIRQFTLILIVTFLGESLKIILPFQIPASVYGLILMLIALQLRIIKIDQVKDTGSFLIEIMPLMFVPAAVGLMVSWVELESVLVPVLAITLISTVIVMVVSGKTTQIILKMDKKGDV
jgi:holin-like protein